MPGVVARAVQILNECIVAGPNCEGIVEDWAGKTLDNMSKFCWLVEGLTLAVGEDCTQVVDLVEVELSKVGLVSTTALT